VQVRQVIGLVTGGTGCRPNVLSVRTGIEIRAVVGIRGQRKSWPRRERLRGRWATMMGMRPEVPAAVNDSRQGAHACQAKQPTKYVGTKVHERHPEVRSAARSVRRLSAAPRRFRLMRPIATGNFGGEVGGSRSFRRSTESTSQHNTSGTSSRLSREYSSSPTALLTSTTLTPLGVLREQRKETARPDGQRHHSSATGARVPDGQLLPLDSWASM
jgi:hypothetical protein